MKKILILTGLTLMLMGCEKNRCFECEATTQGWGETFIERYIVCGKMTKREAEKDYQPIEISNSKMEFEIKCKEQ